MPSDLDKETSDQFALAYAHDVVEVLHAKVVIAERKYHMRLIAAKCYRLSVLRARHKLARAIWDIKRCKELSRPMSSTARRHVRADVSGPGALTGSGSLVAGVS